MKKRVILYADEGKVLKKGDTVGEIIFLEDGESEYSYDEITYEEYKATTESEEV
jgi:hypothetical protein